MKKDLKGHRLTPERQRKVTENMKLVYFLIKTYFHVSRNSPEYEELESEGYIGLVKAALNFDETKNISFGTFASRCINNEIRMYFRKNKKYKRDEYLENYINLDGENELTIKDTIGDKKVKIGEDIISKEEYEELFNAILNWLKPSDVMLVLNYLSGLTQKEIATSLGLSQSYISRKLRGISKKVRNIYSSEIRYKKTFSITKIGEFCYVSFSETDIGEWDKIKDKILADAKKENWSCFNIKNHNGKIKIRILAEPNDKLYNVIAKVFEKIYKYSPELYENI